MRKLSKTQADALLSVQTNGWAEGFRANTQDSLMDNGLIVGGTEAGGPAYVVTEAGEAEYTRATGDTLPARNPVTPDIKSDEVVAVPERSIADGAYDVRKPVALDREERLNIRHWLRPADEVQALRDALLTPVNGHAMTEYQADEVLDAWHVVSNRADRRAEHQADRRQGRRSMRHTRVPSRRRFTSEAAKVRKANRRASAAAFAQNRLDFLAESGTL